MAQDVIDPVHGPVHGVSRLVLVDLRQPPRPLPVAGGKESKQGRKEKLSSRVIVELNHHRNAEQPESWGHFRNKPFPLGYGVSPKTFGFSS